MLCHADKISTRGMAAGHGSEGVVGISRILLSLEHQKMKHLLKYYILSTVRQNYSLEILGEA